MNRDAAIRKIDKYLSKDYVQPMIVNAENVEELQAIRMHYDVGNAQFISAGQYCRRDEFPLFEEMYDKLKRGKDTFFLTGISTFLKLKGEQYLREHLSRILDLQTSAHVVVLVYQCEKYLSFRSQRLLNNIICLDGSADGRTDLVFTTDSFVFEQTSAVIRGIDKLACLEEAAIGTVYVITKKTKKIYPDSLLMIVDRNRAYDVLCQLDSTTSILQESFGTEGQWEYALRCFREQPSWTDVVDAVFGSHKNLSIFMQSYLLYDAEKQWLLVAALKLFGATGNPYLDIVVKGTDSADELVRQIFRTILVFRPDDKEFAGYYADRKQLIRQLGNPSDEAVDFCRIIAGKGRDAIYYLTDATAKEREQIFVTLDKYGTEFRVDELQAILSTVYPALSAYLSDYRFKKELLDDYFKRYKYQKVINKVLPDFEELVIEQAVKREYNLLLSPRSAITESIKRTGAQLYFIDAMGVEYLGFIMRVCKELELMTRVSVCRCELPTITSRNKEFLDVFADCEHPVVSIKDLDEIKHHGKEDYDYRYVKLPLHLSRELFIIRDVLTRIREKLKVGSIKKAVVIADHGASRLAVIREKENIWEMPEKGERSGRCCLKTDLDEQPEYAADAGDYWALANYDRFRGGRKASVEVHGGATLEEVTIPIIELSYHQGEIEVRIMPVGVIMFDKNTVPEIKVSFRKKAAIQIYVSAPMQDIGVRIEGRFYEAKQTDANYYMVEMPEIKRPKMYSVDVYSGDNVLVNGLPLKVASEGMGSNRKGIL